MIWTDTHTHLFLPEFDEDRKDVVQRATEAGVSRLFVPNIDKESLKPLLDFTSEYKDYAYPIIGLHPGSVREDWKEAVSFVFDDFDKAEFVAIGEIGIDLYWPENKKFEKEQKEVFAIQTEFAIEKKLPIVIHTRNSFDLTFDVLESVYKPGLTGIFHCFTGSYEEAKKILDLGFYLGIGGVLTFKNSKLPETVAKLPLDRIVLETDSPYLTPTPYRGKRNESSYIPIIGKKLAEVTKQPIVKIASVTTQNSVEVFGR